MAARPTLRAAILITGLTACADQAPSEPSYTVTDSAGFTIVTSNEPAWDSLAEWSIPAAPSVVIGEVSGDERYLLDGVRSVRRFSDGRIAVLDGGSSRVRVYDRVGGHLVDIGGPGEGPAEFRFPQDLRLVGDTVVVYEPSPPVVTFFHPDGTHIRTVGLVPTTGAGPRFGTAFGMLGDSALVVAAPKSGRPGEEPGRVREPMSLWSMMLDGSGNDSLMAFPGAEVLMNPSGGWNGVPFGADTHYAASTSHIYLADTREYSIKVIDGNARPMRIIRRTWEATTVTAEHVQRYAEQTARSNERGGPELEQRILRILNERGTAESMPAFRMVMASPSGYLWVEDWDDVGVDQGAFSVFRPDGAWLGRVELPPGLSADRGLNLETSVFEVGDQYLLGIWKDDLGVEQVRLYEVQKGR